MELQRNSSNHVVSSVWITEVTLQGSDFRIAKKTILDTKFKMGKYKIRLSNIG